MPKYKKLSFAKVQNKFKMSEKRTIARTTAYFLLQCNTMIVKNIKQVFNNGLYIIFAFPNKIVLPIE